MPRWTVVKQIAAPVDVVFRTVADVAQFAKAVPNVVKVEFLSDGKTGPGTRFRETRLMKGKEQTTELEVIEYVANEHVRLVTPVDEHGFVWDSVFAVQARGGGTLLTLTMDARTERLIGKMILVFIGGMLQT
ncbi:MAG TPA: SRPBCC family protein, partial [Gemmatimonadales bacterium]